MATYSVGGFKFTDENSAKTAAKELKVVDYILSQLSQADDEAVFSMYNKLLEQRLFKTPVGLSFLEQLRANLLNSGEFDKKDIKPVYSVEPVKNNSAATEQVVEKVITSKNETKQTKEKVQRTRRKEKKVVSKPTEGSIGKDDSEEVKRLRLINHILLTVSIVLAICVAGMFYINSTINSPNILNYEESIIDKYSSWEQELLAKEQELVIRERALEQK